MKSIRTEWAFLVLLLANSPSTVVAQQAEVEPFPNYVNADETIPLTPSELYGAFKVNSTNMQEFEVIVQQLDGVVVERSGLLDKMGIALVRRTTTASDGEFTGAMTQLEVSNASLPVFAGKTGEMVLINEFIVRFENDTLDDDAAAAFAEAGAQIVRKSEGIPNQYIITFPNDNPVRALAKANAMARMPQFKYATPNFVVIRPAPRARKEVKPSVSAPIRESRLMSTGALDDWPNDNLYESHQWGLRAINAPTAWQSTTGSCGVSIAIVDSGVALHHEDLNDKILSGWDAVYLDDDPTPSTNDYHGTAVAGVAAAESNNIIGVAGTIWGGKIIVIRITDKSFYSNAPDKTDLSPNDITTFEIVQRGIVKAVALGADVLNFSWKFEKSDPLQTTIQEAIEVSGRVIVAAAGEGESEVAWPASLSVTLDMIAVGAFVSGGAILSSSNPGSGGEVSLVAPGQSIATTDLYGTQGLSMDEYTRLNFADTSAAAPFVAGAAALILSWAPDATPAEVIGWLTNYADNSGLTTTDAAKFGAGRLDIGASIAAIGTTGVVLDIALTPDKRLAYGDSTTVRVTATRNGQPFSGAMVQITPKNFSLASVANAGEYLPTNCNGVAEAIVMGESSGSYDTTEIEAKLVDKTAVIEVRVGNFSWLLVAIVLAGVLALTGLWRWMQRPRTG